MPSHFKRPQRPTGIIRTLPYFGSATIEEEGARQAAYRRMIRSFKMLEERCAGDCANRLLANADSGRFALLHPRRRQDSRARQHLPLAGRQWRAGRIMGRSRFDRVEVLGVSNRACLLAAGSNVAPWIPGISLHGGTVVMAKVSTTCIECGRRDKEDGPEGIIHKTITCRWCQAEGVLPNGTSVRFTQTLDDDATSERPAFTYAVRGETGKVRELYT